MEAWLKIFAVVYRRIRRFYRKTYHEVGFSDNESWTMNVSDGKISSDEPLETIANILEAIIDIILYGSTDVKIGKLSVLQQSL